MKVRVNHTSDTHIGSLTSPRSLEKMFARMARERFDLVLHCGDFSGGSVGSRAVQTTLRMMRRAFGPDADIVATIGNHDLWREPDFVPGRRRDALPPPETFMKNLDEIRDAMAESRVHFLDLDGPWRSPALPGFALVGCMGWYASPKPDTNDFDFLPLGLGGDTHRYLQRMAQQALYRNLDLLRPDDRFVAFASHFPVIELPSDKDPLEVWGWHRGVGEMAAEQFGARFFLNGHTHRLSEGPVRFECGPDYRKPDYRVWELDFGDDGGQTKDQASETKQTER